MRDKLGRFIKGYHYSSTTEFKKGQTSWIKGRNIFKGKDNPFYGKHHTKKSIEKMSNAKQGAKHNFWKGGRFKDSRGYILVYKPDHPFCDDNKHILEHRLIMEQHLGRHLTKNEVVHHINSNLSDNRIENLMLFANHSKHRKFHASLLSGARISRP